MNKNYLEILENASLFKNSNTELCKRILNSSIITKFDKGEHIFDKDENNNIGIILKGDILVKNARPENSTDNIVLNKLTVRDTIGLSTAFSDNANCPFSLVASSNSVVLFIPKEDVKELLTSEKAVLDNYLELVTNNINFLGKKINAFTANSAEEKLSIYLLEHYEEIEKGNNQKEYIVNLNSSVTKFATSLDLGRASLYRALDTLEDNYVILRDKRYIKIINLDKLKKICNR